MVLYSDGPEVTVGIEIAATVDRVWLAVSDPGLPVQFSEELLEASWGHEAGDEPGVGSVILGRNTHPAVGEWTTTSFVTAWEPNLVFEWAVRDVGASAARWRFDLTTTADHTLLRQNYRIGPGPSGVSRWIDADPTNEEQIIADRLAFQSANMNRTLEAVKAMVESP